MPSNTASVSLRERRMRRAAHTARRWFWRALPFVMAAVFYCWIQKDSSFYKFDAVALGIAILMLLVTYIIIESASSLSVTNINVPEELQKHGWTSQTCSNRIADILTAVSSVANLPDFPLTVVERPPIITVKAGAAELSSDVFVKFVSRIFGIASNEVSGEIVAVDGDAGWINIRLRFNHLFVEEGPVAVKHVDELLTGVTYALAWQRAPLATATALAIVAAVDEYRSPEGVALAVKCAQQGGDRRDLSHRERALCRALEALLLFAQWKDAQADEALQRAEDLDKNEIIVKVVRYYRNLERRADSATADNQRKEESPDYDPLGDSLERLVWTTFLRRLQRRSEGLLLKGSVQFLEHASKWLDQVDERISEARAKEWRPFHEGRSLYASQITRSLKLAELDLQSASIWIEENPTDAGPELSERLGNIRAKLDQLRGVLAEEEARPEYVTAAKRAEAIFQRFKTTHAVQKS